VEDHLILETDPIEGEVTSPVSTQNDPRTTESPSEESDALPALPSIQFIGTVSHELRTPLASILGYTQILHEELHEYLEPHHREFFQTILLNVELSLDVVSDLLDFARLDAGQLALRTTPVAIQPLISQVIDQLHPLAAERDIALSADLHHELSYIEADEIRLRQVLINVLTNAIKYTDEGSVTVQVSARGDAQRPEHVIEIIDTGRGIQADFLPVLFGRYTREERLAQLVHQGAGIGLAISLEYVLAMDGHVEVDSSPDVGTTFRLSFKKALLDYFNGDDTL
jgi:signal transduction histidine kinase